MRQSALVLVLILGIFANGRSFAQTTDFKGLSERIKTSPYYGSHCSTLMKALSKMIKWKSPVPPLVHLPNAQLIQMSKAQFLKSHEETHEFLVDIQMIFPFFVGPDSRLKFRSLSFDFAERTLGVEASKGPSTDAHRSRLRNIYNSFVDGVLRLIEVDLESHSIPPHELFLQYRYADLVRAFYESKTPEQVRQTSERIASILKAKDASSAAIQWQTKFGRQASDAYKKEVLDFVEHVRSDSLFIDPSIFTSESFDVSLQAEILREFGFFQSPLIQVYLQTVLAGYVRQKTKDLMAEKFQRDPGAAEEAVINQVVEREFSTSSVQAGNYNLVILNDRALSPVLQRYVGQIIQAAARDPESFIFKPRKQSQGDLVLESRGFQIVFKRVDGKLSTVSFAKRSESEVLAQAGFYSPEPPAPVAVEVKSSKPYAEPIKTQDNAKPTLPLVPLEFTDFEGFSSINAGEIFAAQIQSHLRESPSAIEFVREATKLWIEEESLQEGDALAWYLSRVGSIARRMEAHGLTATDAETEIFASVDRYLAKKARVQNFDYSDLSHQSIDSKSSNEIMLFLSEEKPLKELEANRVYPIEFASTPGVIQEVSFSEEAVVFINKNHRGLAWLRAIRKGFAPQHSGSGIVRFYSAPFDYEIKVRGRGGHERLSFEKRGSRQWYVGRPFEVDASNKIFWIDP